ncbi:MAG: hypothetical protein SYNGOMJ08_00759 [Candidatus Syntrophoarchaeum sp. GoM_oil]|nr:MAG: hypothetical protein SYNGOMJ08_00759 [Candidatus Syntrophoarchaeum sp. GoM_oil]
MVILAHVSRVYPYKKKRERPEGEGLSMKEMEIIKRANKMYKLGEL